VEKVAEKAGRAAPAMAIAGALVAAPQAQHALANSATVATAHAHKPAAHQQTAALESVASHGSIISIAASTRHAAAQAAARTIHYKVQTGDTLSSIAGRYYHNAADWPWLYHENDKTVQDPNLIYTGETLVVPTSVPAGILPASYVPRHAKAAASATSGTSSSGSTSRTGGSTASTAAVTQIAGQGGSAVVGSGAGTGSRSGHPMGGGGSGSGSRSGSPMGSGGGGRGVLGGTLSCSGLETLWDAAGGNPHDAFIAAEIAMAESGGNQYAVSPTDDYGYWQINASHGSLATFNALGNAKAAIIISNDGTDWNPWTTYTSGAYIGRC
jgi:LysM repeat protein